MNVAAELTVANAADAANPVFFYPAQLAGLLLRLDAQHGAALRPLLQRLLQALEAGNVCLHGLSDEELAVLRSSPLVAAASAYAPLILEKRRLYFARQWLDEVELAAGILRLAAAAPDEVPDEARLVEVLQQLFGAENGLDWQRMAAKLALQRRFLTISGGPGTGKTTTVVRLLAALAMTSSRPLVMAMAAPTGKAAARLTESVRAAQARMALSATLKATLPQSAQTLHRLIGLIPGVTQPKHHAANPLPLDVLVIDEASMIDLGLMAQTIRALPAHARLILLGDKDQLSSVDAGAVLADICSQQCWRTATAKEIAALGGVLPGRIDDSATLADSVVILGKSHRFAADSGIGQLARAVNGGEVADVATLLAEARADLAQQAALPTAAELIAMRQAYWQCAAEDEPSPAAMFAAFSQLMLLAAERHVVAGINRQIETELERQGRKSPERDWYAGRPVMISENDYTIGLFNGDVGLTVRQDNQLRVVFPTADGGWRYLSPARLPRHETVFAMTVHKSQGSEFDTVWLVLPDAPSAILTRALLYTAITRARSTFVLAGNPAILAAGVKNAPLRQSGLAQRLWSR